MSFAFLLCATNAAANEGLNRSSAASMVTAAVVPLASSQSLPEPKEYLPSGLEVTKGLGLHLAQKWQQGSFNSVHNGGSLQKPIAPFAFTRISSDFGARRDPFAGTWRSHQGIDLPGVTGTPVYAVNDGWVSFSGFASGYGLMVRLDHGHGAETLYGHLSGVALGANQSVRKGRVIGYLGSTGRSTGPHLHFEVRQFGREVDPLTYLATGSYTSQFKPPSTAPQSVHISDHAKQRPIANTGPAGLPGSL